MLLTYFKRIGINSFIYSLGDFLIMGFGIILIPFYTRYFVPSDYGIINYLLAISNFLLPFLSLSIFQAIAYKYFDFLKDPKRFKVFFSTILYFGFCFSILFLAFILFSEYYLGLFTSVQLSFYPLFFLSVITCFFSQFMRVPLLIFRCQEKALKYSLLNFLNFIIGIGLLVFFVAYLKQGVLGNVRALLISSALMAGVTFFIVRKYLTFNFSFGFLKKALYLTIPLIPHGFSATVLTLLDRIILARLDTLRVVGLYSLSYQLNSVLVVMGTAITASIYPLFFKLHKQKHKEAANISGRMITVAIYAFIFITLCLAVFSKEIIHILTIQDYYSAHKIVPILALGAFFYFLYFMSGIPISYLKKTSILLACSSSAAGLNLVLNIILIPPFSQLGAAVATAISYFLMAAVGYFLIRKLMPLPLNKGQLISSFVIGLVIVLAGLAVNMVPISVLSVLAKTLLLVAFPLILIKLKFIDVSGTISLVKSKLKKL